MSDFMAMRIMKQRKYGVEKGKEKYAFYFKGNLYQKYRTDVDTSLKVNGYEDCIMTDEELGR